jgi:hypothetical protein
VGGRKGRPVEGVPELATLIIKSTVLDPGGQAETKFKKLDNNLPVRFAKYVSETPKSTESKDAKYVSEKRPKDLWLNFALPRGERASGGLVEWSHTARLIVR